MEWPTHVYAEQLFPSLEALPTQILLPLLPKEKPVWDIFDGASPNSLKQQLSKINPSTVNYLTIADLPATTTFDEKNGPVMIQKGALIEPSTHFIGPCFVGSTAIVRHGAYVRENAWICSGALVGHCSEIKHSVLLPGSKAPHFNYVGDSILGNNVNLGAGVKLSNLRNDGTEIYLRLEGLRIPSGLRKFGAILGEGVQLGCNAVTNPGTILGNDSVVWPNVTVTGVHGNSSTHR